VGFIYNHTDHLAFLGTTIGTEPFSDLDFADDVDGDAISSSDGTRDHES